jgi:serine/threonine protein kinase
VHDVFVMRREVSTFADTLRILRESAVGIMHLHKENVIHRDIAARNFLLDDRRNVFVTDFGLARVKMAAYQHTKSSMGPVKYMAPESIAKKRYSEQSDVFSFGVYIWEVMHRREPYADKDTFDIITGVVAGTLRLDVDEFVLRRAPALASLMRECWHAEPGQRLTFAIIFDRLTSMMVCEGRC